MLVSSFALKDTFHLCNFVPLFTAEVEMPDSKLIFSRRFSCRRVDCLHHDNCTAHADKHIKSPTSFKPKFDIYIDPNGKVSIYCSDWSLEPDEAKRTKSYTIAQALLPPGSVRMRTHRVIKGSSYDVPSGSNGGRSAGGNGSS